MAEVLDIAQESLQHMLHHVDDYTATLVKQETIDGVLSEPSQISLKVQCPHRGGKVDESEPTRLYLRFEKPADVAGREVIWGKDLHDGQLVVHEAGLMGFVTLRLDPTGMIAMRGQRYPIWEIGLTNLAKKLIERGELDRTSEDVHASIEHGIEFNGRPCDLIVVRRDKPSERTDDFSRAEICIDTQRHLPLRYTAYGWPSEGNDAPLLESYTYLDININIGLTELDFDPSNPSYQFP